MNASLARAINAHIRHTTAEVCPPKLSPSVRRSAGPVSFALSVFIVCVVILACMVAK
jgi:hypothetical protein